MYVLKVMYVLYVMYVCFYVCMYVQVWKVTNLPKMSSWQSLKPSVRAKLVDGALTEVKPTLSNELRCTALKYRFIGRFYVL
jgi:hypothetical protein